MRHRFSVLVWVATAALAAACYSTPQPNCAFRCGVDQDCPSGYACEPVGQICHLLVGDTLAECDVVVTPDAETAIDGKPAADAFEVPPFEIDAPIAGG